MGKSLAWSSRDKNTAEPRLPCAGVGVRLLEEFGFDLGPGVEGGRKYLSY